MTRQPRHLDPNDSGRDCALVRLARGTAATHALTEAMETTR